MDNITKQKRIVYIEVDGGVAEVISCPDDVEVKIRDLDNERAEIN